MNTRVVGYQIARFVQFHRRSVQISHKTNLFVLKRFLEHIENATNVVSTSDNSNWGPLYLIGHSLGAHICGFASKELKRRQSKWKIERITGLDPAQPCFKNADSSVKLHKTDAPFVDVIHTNGRLLFEIGLGLPEPMG